MTGARPERDRSILGGWRWLPLALGLLYLILLAAHAHAVIQATYLDADTASAPVIGQLLGGAPAHATVVLGEFGWYATLLFELATKPLPSHLDIWEAAPYAMALAGCGLVTCSVWQVAGRWAASLTAVLLICAAPATLHLLLSMTQHAPDWFCAALLAAFVVTLARRAATLRWTVSVPAVLTVGLIVGVNAASDPLVVIAGLAPFTLALLAGPVAGRTPDSVRALALGLATLAVAGIGWLGTVLVVAGLNVTREHGLDTTTLATAGKVASNLGLWLQSIAVLGNGDFFGHTLSLNSGLALACAALSILAVLLLLRAAWREACMLAGTRTVPAVAGRHAFIVFWCSSAVLLSAAFLFSATPADVHADRYLVGVIYAAAAAVPVLASGRRGTEAVALAGTCVVALGGVVSMAQGTVDPGTARAPSVAVARDIARIAAAEHLTYGYAGYWDAAPITLASRFRVQVYPVSVCDQGHHLCTFDLHFISSWYKRRNDVGSFLLTDPSPANVPAPTPDLGRPVATYHLGRITMYVYPYDVAARIVD